MDRQGTIMRFGRADRVVQTHYFAQISDRPEWAFCSPARAAAQASPCLSDAPGESVAKVGRHPDGQSGFPDAAGTGHPDEPHVVSPRQGTDGSDLPLPADERRQRHRESGRNPFWRNDGPADRWFDARMFGGERGGHRPTPLVTQKAPIAS
jgi:hypothetical protein